MAIHNSGTIKRQRLQLHFVLWPLLVHYLGLSTKASRMIAVLELSHNFSFCYTSTSLPAASAVLMSSIN